MIDVVPGPPHAECLGGERAAPPEDAGGPHAYQDILNGWGKAGRRGLAKDVREWLPRALRPRRLRSAPPPTSGCGRPRDSSPSRRRRPSFADADEQLLADVTLLALHLGSWEESSGRRTAWKTVRFEVLDVLKRAGLIDTTPARKSVVITDQGIRRAAELRNRLAALINGGDS